MAKRKILLTIQYDGSDYHGWQVQPGSSTVQGQLISAISSLIGKEVSVRGASRTDAGVSALGQLAVFEIDDCPIPTGNFKKAINDRLPDDIVITELKEVPLDFDLIGSVKNKLYRYTIYTGPTRPVLDIKHLWHLPADLDVEAMDKAAKHLVGKHDFKSFASAKDARESSIRTIFRCDVSLSGKRQFLNHGSRTTNHEYIFINVEGDGFLYNMVRNIVGSLVEVGTGRWEESKIKEVLEANDRTAAGPIAPPQGLCLIWIKY